MASDKLMRPVADRPLRVADEVIPLNEPQFSESLPLMMVSTLERRYLTGLQSGQWDIAVSASIGDHKVMATRRVIVR